MPGLASTLALAPGVGALILGQAVAGVPLEAIALTAGGGGLLIFAAIKILLSVRYDREVAAEYQPLIDNERLRADRAEQREQKHLDQIAGLLADNATLRGENAALRAENVRLRTAERTEERGA